MKIRELTSNTRRLEIFLDISAFSPIYIIVLILNAGSVILDFKVKSERNQFWFANKVGHSFKEIIQQERKNYV